MDEYDDDSPVFTAPSGQSLDEPLSSLLDRVAETVDRLNIIAIGVVFIDAECNASSSRIVTHPLAHELLAKRFRSAAEAIETQLKVDSPPENNSSFRLH
jgi:hypothetical protein